MNYKLFISIVAPIVNCIQQLPQLIKTYKIKHVKDLSLFSIILIVITNILWLSHGFIINDKPLIYSGLISVIINVSLLSLYFLYLDNL